MDDEQQLEKEALERLLLHTYRESYFCNLVRVFTIRISREEYEGITGKMNLPTGITGFSTSCSITGVKVNLELT